MSISKQSVASLEHERYQKYSLELHQRRLKEIHSKSPRISKLSVKLRSRKQTETQAVQKELEQQNLVLLKKLIDIAKAKDRSPPRSITPLPRTLNSINRKKEIIRINEENKRIAGRIASQSPVVSAQVFQKKYLEQSKYREILKKFSLFNQKRAFSNKNLESMDKGHKIYKTVKASSELTSSAKRIENTKLPQLG